MGQVPMNEPIVIAHSQQGSIHTVAVPWEKGLSYIGHKTSIDQLSSIENEEVKLQTNRCTKHILRRDG